MRREEVDINKVTPMMKQYLEVKNTNPEIILFFRLGDFYEMFFDDAEKVSHELELTLTGKSCGLEERVPMCGIPYHAANVYLEKLINKGYKVGICEQLEDPKNVKGIVRRDITRIVSIGTNINEETLKENSNNYIGALQYLSNTYFLVYTDITTGIIYAEVLDNNITNIISTIVSLDIKEMILSSKIDKSISSLLLNQFSITNTIYDEIETIEEYNYIYEDIKNINIKETIKYLLTYLTNTQKRSLSHMQKAIIKENNSYMKMDIHTKRNLELTETLRLKDRQYSLIWLLDKTKTAMGSRLLKTWIENPLINKEEIEKRYEIVDTLITEFIVRDDLEKYLYEVYDLERLAGRVAFGSANGRDLVQLRNSLKVLPNINELLTKINFGESLDNFDSLYALLDNSLYENPPVNLKEGYLIKEGFNEELDYLKGLRKGGKDFVATFEREEREKTGIKNLKVGYNKVFGYFIEVSKGNTNLVKEEYGYERKQTLANCERYISPVLKEKEDLILNAEEKIINLEYDLFIAIRDKVKEYIPLLQNTSKVLSKIDVLCSFSTISEENNYVRPILSDDHVLDIKDDRHPVVEKVIKGEFVSNDITMDKDTSVLLITGPNMAGKSTYMRQMAITSIMAQIGCFVPATKAVLPVFDAIYTRIGASDDLVSGESTFMVEMLEAGRAIENATKNSLILFDELGRGTATFDGMALAQSIIEYISTNIKCKTFFSTHYHELTDLEDNLTNLKNIHVSAKEENGEITFLHKIKKGSVDKSYGIYVAKLAKLPVKLINRAEEILKVYEGKEIKRDMVIQESLPLDELMVEESQVEKELKQLDLNNMTPMDALNYLYNIKNKLK